MTYWPWWLSGIALAGVMIFHWLSTGRMMAVSGRFTALVNRLRLGKEEAAPEMSPEDLLLAIQGATLAEFDDGPDAAELTAVDMHEHPDVVLPPKGPENADTVANISLKTQAPLSHHILFFAGLVLGGASASLVSGSFAMPSFGLRSVGFQALTHGQHILSAAVLLVGGMLVGAGTRMAGGCTSGHGLCGVSRLQPGSLLATTSFFGVGIAVSFLLGQFL